MERQIHGLLFEEDIIRKYNMIKSTNNIAKWDAYYKDIPVSIKLTKNKNFVSFGDLFRQTKIDEDFILISGFWEEEKDNIVRIDYFYIKKELWLKEFPEKDVAYIKNVFNGITNLRKDDLIWKKRRKKYIDYWRKNKSLFTVNFKRDHKNQKRIQCSLSNKNYELKIKEFIKINNLNDFNIIKKGITGSLGKKEEHDKFYTKNKIVDYCLSKIDLSDYDCVIEPSAGNGSFSNKIKNCFAYDIIPENSNIIKADWLKLNKNKFNKYNNILVIGNPPYGKNNSLSLKFIKESSFANTIAFILPKSYQKESLLNKINPYFHLVKVVDLPNDSFLLKNQSYSLKTAFFIFKKMKYKRVIKAKKLQSSYFSFVNKNENPDFRIQRVGVKAGSISTDFNRASSSNYFIKVNTKLISKKDFYNKINSIDFTTVTDLSIGPKSLSKRELIEIFEE